VTLPSRIAGCAVTSARRVGGGDINEAYAVELEGAGRAFVKTRAGAAPGEYEAEAAGLRWLAEGGAHVPQVLEATDTLLALEWLEEGTLDAQGEEELGRTLALTHRSGASAFGATPAGAPVLRIGPIELPSPPTEDDWPRFYAECRLLALVPDAGLSPGGRRAVQAVCERIADLAGPPEPPARLHGDLWTGNVHASGNRPYLVDPAAYGGHREVDLAMLRLFGGAGAIGARTLRAYEEVAPLAPGHQDRVGLWQLFPLLVHAVLFSGTYGASVERTAKRYV
jgi:fructosamine-3-kinase